MEREREEGARARGEREERERERGGERKWQSGEGGRQACLLAVRPAESERRSRRGRRRRRRRRKREGGESGKERESVCIFHGIGLHDFLNPRREAGGRVERQSGARGSSLTHSEENRHAIVGATL